MSRSIKEQSDLESILEQIQAASYLDDLTFSQADMALIDDTPELKEALEDAEEKLQYREDEA